MRYNEIMKRKIIASILVFSLLLIAAGILFCNSNLRQSIKEAMLYPELPKNPGAGEWYSLSPENAVSADGSKWKARIRIGDPDKLILYFLGGGVVLDDFSATKSYANAGSAAFYYDNDLGVSARRMQTGIASDAPENPFRNWTILMIPYTTGDFHVGNGGIHQGYANFKSLMDMLGNRLGTPEQLIITGYSAGGFGSAMLAEDILGCFPETENALLLIDSALLLHDEWKEIAQNRWHAPEHISSRIRTENLTLDHLSALHESHPQLKILFASSVRDGGLAKFQSYMDGGAYRTTDDGGLNYRENLRRMVEDMQTVLPDAAVYLWDDADFPRPTTHTMLYRDDFFAPMSGGISPAEWILHALEGNAESQGIELLMD